MTAAVIYAAPHSCRRVPFAVVFVSRPSSALCSNVIARWYTHGCVCLSAVNAITLALCIRRTLCRHVTIGTPMVIFAVLTAF